MDKESPQHQSKARKPRSDKGRPQLTQRDEIVLRLIGEQTAYCFDQLQTLLARHAEHQPQGKSFLSENRTRELIARWQALGLAKCQKIYNDMPSWISLTSKGLYHCDLPFRFIDPRHSDLEHIFWINETRELIETTYGSLPGFQWESERQYRAIYERFKAQQKRDPDVWIPYEYRGTHRPDALLRYRLNDEADTSVVISAIEVELSEKAYTTWKKIFMELMRFFTNAHYYVDPDIKSTFTKALDKFQNEEPAFGEPGTERRQHIYIHDIEQRL